MMSDASTISGSARVAVVIPVYNQAHLLAECLQSVVAQTIQDWQAVVVDDASTSGDVSAVVSRFADARFHVVRHGVNRGLAAARNAGFRQARCDLVLPLDADDKILPAFLETLLEQAAEHPECDAFYTDVQYFGARDYVWRTAAQSAREFLHRKRIPGPGVLVRRSLWERAGGYCEAGLLRIGQEDTDFWIAAFEQGMRPCHVAKPLYLYRRHEESMTARVPPKYHLVRNFIYRRHKAFIDGQGIGGQFVADGYWRSALGRWRAGRRRSALWFALRAFWASGQPLDKDLFEKLLQGLQQGSWYFPLCQRASAGVEPSLSSPG